MTDPLRTTGLHHVSVLAADARRLLPFWTDVLGQRLVKRTVNYDAPTMHHLYVGDGEGDVGATLTFFPIRNAAPATLGTGETVATAYGVAEDAIDAWERRLRDRGVSVVRDGRWDRPVLSFRDPDGLPVELVGLSDPPATAGWPAEPVPETLRLRGFESVTLRLADAAPTLALLDAMGYRTVDERAEGRARRLRLATDGAERGTGLEIVEEGRPLPGRAGRGTVHHVAFRLPDEATQRAAQEALRERGLNVSDVRDRDYFRSIYVREPGGVLFEFATDGPGLTVDEPVDALGSALRLPAFAEPKRAAIGAGLPPLSDARQEVPA